MYGYEVCVCVGVYCQLWSHNPAIAAAEHDDGLRYSCYLQLSVLFTCAKFQGHVNMSSWVPAQMSPVSFMMYSCLWVSSFIYTSSSVCVCVGGGGGGGRGGESDKRRECRWWEVFVWGGWEEGVCMW